MSFAKQIAAMQIMIITFLQFKNKFEKNRTFNLNSESDKSENNLLFNLKKLYCALNNCKSKNRGPDDIFHLHKELF